MPASNSKTLMSSQLNLPAFDPLFQKFSAPFRILFYWMILGVFLFFHLVVYPQFAGFYPFAPVLFLVSFVFLSDILCLLLRSSPFFDSRSVLQRGFVSKQAFFADSFFIFGLTGTLGGAWLAAPLIAAFFLMCRSGLAETSGGGDSARLNSALSIFAAGLFLAFLMTSALLFRSELEKPHAAFINIGLILIAVLSVVICRGVLHFRQEGSQSGSILQSAGADGRRSGVSGVEARSGAGPDERAERNLSFRLAKHLKAALNALIKRATKESAAVDKLKSLQRQAARLTDFIDSCQKKGRPFHQAEAFPDLIRDLKQQLKESSLSLENAPEPPRPPGPLTPEPPAQAPLKQVASRLESLRQRVLRFIDFVEEPYDSPFQEIRNFNELASSALAESSAEILLREERQNLHERRDLRAKGAVQGSPEDLQKAVKELLTNSFQALKEEKNKTIFLKTYDSKGFLILEVIDNGHGMTEEERKAAFDPLPLFSKRRGDMRGLGLSLAKKIVEAHGGFIELESAGDEILREQDFSTKPKRADNKNKGTLARIRLPLLPVRKQDSPENSTRRLLKRRSA